MKKNLFISLLLTSLALSAANMAVNPDGEEGSGKNIPGWGFFSMSEFGISQELKVSGKQSVFAGEKKTSKMDLTKPRWKYLLIGSPDGRNASKAFKVQPRKKYVWSVRLYGDAGLVEARMFVWPEKQFTNVKQRKVSRVYGSLYAQPRWQKLSGIYESGNEAERVVLALRTPEIKPGQRLYADLVTFEEMPTIKQLPRPKSPKVAIYDAGENYGQKMICEILNKKRVSCNLISTLDYNTIKKYDVLILTTFRNLSKQDRGDLDSGRQEVDWVSSVYRFVDSGKGLILGHDCVGERGIWETPLFPQLSTGTGLSKNRIVKKTNAKHYTTHDTDAVFQHDYADHVKIKPGPRTEVLARDGNGDPVVTVFEFNRGRLAAFGFPIAVNAKDQVVVPNQNELKMLINAINWSSWGSRYDVPEILTDIQFLTDYNYRKSLKTAGKLQEEQNIAKRIAGYPAPDFFKKTIWCFGMRIYSDAQMEKIVRNAKELGATTFLIQANHGHGLLYKSDIYPDCTWHPKKKFYDVVSGAAKYARKYGLKLAIGVLPFIAGANSHCGLAPEITQSDREALAAGQTTMDKLKKRRGWMCPVNPENQARAFAIAKELIKKFQPDEIAFDYVRFSRGYETPCFCDQCNKKRGEMEPAAFARKELMDFYTKMVRFCKKQKSGIVVSAYTMSNAPEWVFSYPFDEHQKYVSTENSISLGNVEKLTKQWYQLMQKYNPRGRLVPIISNYDPKTGERLYLEFKSVSKVYNDLKLKNRPVLYYAYDLLAEDPSVLLSGKLKKDPAGGIRKAFQGK